jgi:hypothetical protein
VFQRGYPQARRKRNSGEAVKKKYVIVSLWRLFQRDLLNSGATVAHQSCVERVFSFWRWCVLWLPSLACLTPPATVHGNTVRSFSTHGHQSAAKGSSTTVSRSDIRLISTFLIRLCGLMVRRWRLIGYFPILYNPQHIPSPLRSARRCGTPRRSRCSPSSPSRCAARPPPARWLPTSPSPETACFW